MNKHLPVMWLTVVFAALSGNAQESNILQETSVSADIYDVTSPDEIHNFSAKEIRELVQIENTRPQRFDTVPHPVLIHCFDEQSFRYTGGKYQDEEFKYRLHTPKSIRYGQKYLLVVYLHGAGEAGSNNFSSLVYLHSILPVLIGPESEDFFMLVMQCPADAPTWNFQPSKDGTLDILVAMMEHVIAENPIDRKRITTAGVSSGGWGVWTLISRHPDVFAGAVPTASGVHLLQEPAALKKTPIWSFINKGDVNPESILNTMNKINDAGGLMALTETDAPGHNAWTPAMEDYNCLRWMLAQKRGSWFAPPPGVIVYNKPHSSILVPVLYILPFAIIVLLSWGIICEQISTAYQAVREWLGMD